MRPISVTVGPLAAGSANAIALSQTPTAALTLNGSLVTGGVAVMDTPRRVLITTTANESAKTFTITGTDPNGNPVIDIVSGVNNSTAQSHLDFATVTAITISAAAAGALTVGTNGVASSRWVRLDNYAPGVMSVQVLVTGTTNWTVEETLSEPSATVLPYAVPWLTSSIDSLVAQTTSVQATYPNCPLFVKLTVNSSTSPGAVTATFVQNSAVPY